MAYTYSDGEFRSDLADSNFFGDAERGDPIPYLPEHEIYVSLGLEMNRWAINASGQLRRLDLHQGQLRKCSSKPTRPPWSTCRPTTT